MAETRTLVVKAFSASVFKIKQDIFLDTWIQKTYFLIMEIHKFRGKLADITAEKEALKALPVEQWRALQGQGVQHLRGARWLGKPA